MNNFLSLLFDGSDLGWWLGTLLLVVSTVFVFPASWILVQCLIYGGSPVPPLAACIVIVFAASCGKAFRQIAFYARPVTLESLMTSSVQHTKGAV